MVDFMKKLWAIISLIFFSASALADPPIYGPLQAQNNLNDVDSASASLANIGGAPLASPTFTGTVTIPTIVVSGGTINGTTVGGSTPSTGAFTNLSSSGTVSGTGFSTYLASPPAIGSSTPSTGSFTALSATGTVTGIGLIGVQFFGASSATYTADPGTQAVIVVAMGGGGGGGGSATTAAGQSAVGGGGSSGSWGESYYTSGFNGVTVTAGGGPAGGAAGVAGGTGPTASFGSLLSCPGGVGGFAGSATSSAETIASSNVPAASCTNSGGTQLYTTKGSASKIGVVITPGTVSASSQGADCPWGTGGRGVNTEAGGGVAGGHCSGGGGANSLASSGSGETGGAGGGALVIVYEFN